VDFTTFSSMAWPKKMSSLSLEEKREESERF